MTDKGELLRSFLEERGVRLSSRAGWQSISCINKAAHRHGDANQSAAANLTKGTYKCHACDYRGDAYDLLMSEQGVDFKTARATLGASTPGGSREVWL